MLCNCNFIVHATKHTKSEVKLFEAFLSESECSLMIIFIAVLLTNQIFSAHKRLYYVYIYSMYIESCAQ